MESLRTKFEQSWSIFSQTARQLVSVNTPVLLCWDANGGATTEGIVRDLDLCRQRIAELRQELRQQEFVEQYLTDTLAVLATVPAAKVDTVVYQTKFDVEVQPVDLKSKPPVIVKPSVADIARAPKPNVRNLRKQFEQSGSIDVASSLPKNCVKDTVEKSNSIDFPNSLTKNRSRDQAPSRPKRNLPEQVVHVDSRDSCLRTQSDPTSAKSNEAKVESSEIGTPVSQLRESDFTDRDSSASESVFYSPMGTSDLDASPGDTEHASITADPTRVSNCSTKDINQQNNEAAIYAIPFNNVTKSNDKNVLTKKSSIDKPTNICAIVEQSIGPNTVDKEVEKSGFVPELTSEYATPLDIGVNIPRASESTESPYMVPVHNIPGGSLRKPRHNNTYEEVGDISKKSPANVEEETTSSDEEMSNVIVLRQSVNRASQWCEVGGNTRTRLQQQAQRLSNRFSSLVIDSPVQPTSGPANHLEMLLESPAVGNDDSWLLTPSVLSSEDLSLQQNGGDMSLGILNCGKPEKMEMRKWVVTSLLKSERSYLSILDTLVQYLQMFKQMTQSGSRMTLKSDCLDDCVDVMFTGIKQLHKFHYEFIHDLEPLVADWSPTQQIAEIFKVLAMEEYRIAPDYLKNYQKSIVQIQNFRRENSTFDDITKKKKVPTATLR